MKRIHLQAVMELQESTRSLKDAVDALSGRDERRQREIRRTAQALWMTGGALLLLSLVVVWWIDNRIDEIPNALAKGGG